MTPVVEEVDSEVPAAEQPISAEDQTILDEAKKQYRMCVDADSENRTAALEDLNFLTGGLAQWDTTAVAARKADGRPMITVNSLPTFLHQVTNDQRQNSPSIKVHPVDNKADIGTAKVRQGMIRHIEYDSNADVAYDRAVNSAAAVGFGYWRLVTEYENESSFNQKIMYKSIRNALSVRIDPLSTEPDGSDQQFCFIESAMNRDEFKRKHPKASANTWPLLGDASTNYDGWLSDNIVLVCEYYRIEKSDCEVVLLSDGSSGYIDELVPNGDEKLLPTGLTVANRRPGTRKKVMWYKITAVDILERQEIKCNWIPVFPVYGDEIDIEGKVIRSGIIRHAKGPAQMYNVMITSATEEVSLRSKSPYMMAEGQEEGHEEEFAQANNRAFPYLTYKPVALGDKLAPPPQRQPMADVPTGMLAMAMHARDNVKATTGLFDSSLGNRGNATSGIQEREQQQQGDMANFHYFDGLLRSLRHCGRCIDSMIPHYYDAQRTIRILGEDNSADYAEINKPNVEGEKGEDGSIREVLNDMTGGAYDITVAAGPKYSTLREESAEVMGKMMEKNPNLWGVFGDLYVRSQDWPNAEEIAARVEKTIPPQLLDEGDEDGEMIQTPKGPMPVAQVPKLIEEMSVALQNADKMLDETKMLEEKNKSRELDIKDKEADTKKYEAETKRMVADADLIRAQAEAAMSGQNLTKVGQAAAAEAVSLVGQMAQEEAMRMPEAPIAPVEQPVATAQPTAPEQPVPM